MKFLSLQETTKNVVYMAPTSSTYLWVHYNCTSEKKEPGERQYLGETYS